MSNIEDNLLLSAYFIKQIAVLMFMDPGKRILTFMSSRCPSAATKGKIT